MHLRFFTRSLPLLITKRSKWGDIVNDRHRLSMNFLKLFDIVLVAMAFGLSTVFIVRAEQSVSLGQFLSIRMKVSDFVIFGLTLFLCHFLLCACGLYRPIGLSSRGAKIGDLLRATTLCTLCFLSISWIFSIRMITGQFLALFWALSTAVICTAREASDRVLGYMRIRSRNLRCMLILGTNPRAAEFARRVLASRERGYRLLGFVDDEWPGITEFKKTGFEMVSDYAGLADFLRRNVVDEVAMYLPFGSFYQHHAEVASLCEQHGIIMRFHADIFRLKTARWRAEFVDGDHYISTYTGTGEGWAQVIKRALDVAVAALLLLLLLPVLLCVAMAVKLSSPGPIFFLQDRIGVNKRRFKIWKFRTMVPDAEKLMASLERQNEAAGPVFKMKNDPRVTPIGRWLRRTSLDELPQLLNVLRGDMSLVGPRPLPVRDYEGFNEDWQRRRFSIKPGITCLWQVNGRCGISFDQWMRLDLQYLDEWSLWLDLKILAKTIPAVVAGRGAA
jgi:exopolysaccharide biosynthesis polyprenyl glycosylphosphotransferase